MQLEIDQLTAQVEAVNARLDRRVNPVEQRLSSDEAAWNELRDRVTRLEAGNERN